MNRIVLDASAILAILYREPGANKLTVDLLDQAVVSTVNLAEVQGKLVSDGWSPRDAWEDARSPAGHIAPFSLEQAEIAGTLIAQTRHLGLSLGERACLALALDLKASVYTADRSWKGLSVGVSVHVIR